MSRRFRIVLLLLLVAWTGWALWTHLARVSIRDPKQPVVVIVFEGLDRDLCSRMREEGLLPNLSRLAKRGEWRDLRPEVSSASGRTVWDSFALLHEKPFWEVAAEEGIATAVFGFPGTTSRGPRNIPLRVEGSGPRPKAGSNVFLRLTNRVESATDSVGSSSEIRSIPLRKEGHQFLTDLETISAFTVTPVSGNVSDKIPVVIAPMPGSKCAMVQVGERQELVMIGEWSGFFSMSVDASLAETTGEGSLRAFLRSVSPDVEVILTPLADRSVAPLDPAEGHPELEFQSWETEKHGSEWEVARAFEAGIIREESFCLRMEKSMKDRTRSLRRAMRSEDWGLVVAAFPETGRAGSILDRDDASLATVYRAMDESVGRLMSRAESKGAKLAIVSPGVGSFPSTDTAQAELRIDWVETPAAESPGFCVSDLEMGEGPVGLSDLAPIVLETLGAAPSSPIGSN